MVTEGLFTTSLINVIIREISVSIRWESFRTDQYLGHCVTDEILNRINFARSTIGSRASGQSTGRLGPGRGRGTVINELETVLWAESGDNLANFMSGIFSGNSYSLLLQHLLCASLSTEGCVLNRKCLFNSLYYQNS